MEMKAKPIGHVFNLKTPLLAQGKTTDLRAASDLMHVHVKVFQEGGENVMHTHTEEDHVFVVLSGQATFHLDQEENVFVVNQFEGAFLPAGAFYLFENTGEGNLVMVRCGACKPGVDDRRIGPNGNPIPSGTLENKSYPRIEMPGKFFPEDCSQSLAPGVS